MSNISSAWAETFFGRSCTERPIAGRTIIARNRVSFKAYGVGLHGHVPGSMIVYTTSKSRKLLSCHSMEYSPSN